MSFLKIGPITLEIVQDGVDESTAHEIGTSSRAMDGLQQSGIRGLKRRWSCSTLGMSEAEVEALFAVVQPGSFHACTGTLFGGTTPQTLYCLVTVESETLEQALDTPEGFRRVLRLALAEA